MLSEFDKMKDEAEKEAKEHPQQVKEGEQAAEKKLGMNNQDDQTASTIRPALRKTPTRTRASRREVSRPWECRIAQSLHRCASAAWFWGRCGFG